MNSIWNKNYQAFKTRFPQLAELTGSEPVPPESVWSLEQARNGMITASENGVSGAANSAGGAVTATSVRLHSAYHPEREAAGAVGRDEVFQKSAVVFCGFGEPTMRLDVLTALLRWLREAHPEVRTRLNTNGLSDLYYGRDTASDFSGLLDTISISLNASNAERYLALTRSRFGLVSFDAMLAFAEHAKAYVPDVVLTVVDHVEDDGEIKRCKALCEARGLRLRVRPYEAS